jgi:hypothetical protein
VSFLIINLFAYPNQPHTMKSLEQYMMTLSRAPKQRTRGLGIVDGYQMLTKTIEICIKNTYTYIYTYEGFIFSLIF